MPRTFVTCKFREDDQRTYTYEYNGTDPLAPGDKVRVPARGSDPDAWQRVIVAQVGVPQPSFACKAILGRYEEPPQDGDDD